MIHLQQFGKYRIVRKLPGGAMGVVYQAIDSTSNAMVALKLIEHGTDPESIEILAAERRGAALHERLSRLDERVTYINEYGDLDGCFFITMEFIEGHDLSELLARDGIGVPFAVRIATDVCEVLEHAHNLHYHFGGEEYRGVVHGDIKPRNIRITSGGAVKVLDFGIAKALSDTRKHTRNLFGSIQYSSPERLKTGDVDAASDLWSVGVVLYESIARKPYFSAENVARTEHAIRNYNAVLPMPPQAPPDLQAILMRALAPDPRDRYATAAEFRDDLVAFIEERPVFAASAADAEMTRRTSAHASAEEDAGATRRTTATVAAAPDEATRRTNQPPSVPFRKPPQRRDPRWRAAKRIIGAACALLLALLAWHEISLTREAGQLRTALRSEQLQDLDAAWKRYDAMASASYFPILLRTTRTALLDKMLEKTDATIFSYRHSDVVREGDWTRARDTAARALTLVPGDRDVTARVRLSQGHINRIKGSVGGNQKLGALAREQFEEAARLTPKSPDPYLGLARLYIYNLRDVDAAEEALRQAEKRGFKMGERETAQLADGYRYRGDQFSREAQKAQRSNEEKDYLERAKKDYRRAQDLYNSIVPFGDSAQRLRDLHDQIAEVEVRMEAVKNEGSWR